MTNTLKLKCGTVYLKPFIDRKTMREYRAAMMKNSKMEIVRDENGRSIMDEITGLAKKELVFDTAQMDVCNDVLVRGIIERIEKDDTTNEVLSLTDSFFDSMMQEDFDKILEVALSMMKNRDEEKKSS